jgi:hypothetical protein
MCDRAQPITPKLGTRRAGIATKLNRSQSLKGTKPESQPPSAITSANAPDSGEARLMWSTICVKASLIYSQRPSTRKASENQRSLSVPVLQDHALLPLGRDPGTMQPVGVEKNHVT